MADGDLAGIGVLVTRPRHQAGELVEAIAAAGGTAVCFPAIAIVPRAGDAVATDVAALREPDIAIYVSANAVRYGLEYSGSARIAAIGPATAAAIRAAGWTVDIQSPAGFNSEHLLGEPELHDIAGKTVRIIRGSAGRELLATTLRARGANVEYLAVYAREAPRPTAAELDALEQDFRSGGIGAVTIMSVETLVNLDSMLPERCRELLRQTVLVTPTERVIIEANKRFPGVTTALADGTGAADIVRAIARRAPGHS